MDDALAFLYGNELILDFKDNKTRLTLTRSKKYITPPPADTPSQGTGFALTSDGYLATNYHVIRNAKEVVVHGLNREFPQSFNADIVAVDSINDLAILHINDNNFIDFGELPYSIINRIARKGETVFYMGYPRTDIVGYEIKTAIGHISAIEGLYLTSVDVDHGSSGSPLFDDDGNVIGIIVSIFPNYRTNLEASYAVKSQHLLKLIETVDGINLQQKNKTKELSYPDRIETIAPFVYLIHATH
jgi:S1-C subfamily serine protease